jgi:hypothetical protein
VNAQIKDWFTYGINIPTIPRTETIPTRVRKVRESRFRRKCFGRCFLLISSTVITRKTIASN